MLNINNNDIDKNNSDIVKKEDNVDEQEIESPKGITIYISGAIKNPGILTIDKEKRLYDAIEELGGVTEEADLNRVNLALKLSDEQHYIIPKIGEEIQVADNSVQGSTTQESKNNQSKIVNINLATLEELDSLPGVGEATANKIINYREENSSFKSIEEIKNVNGIGDKKYEDLKDLICTN
ncbi:competence protein ComE [Romboutsia weinsteinii]|uniref:Competence protein ComE n=2 Tax=Romboutsia weinsteinii TaxID=2020949 RepID=A0A371JAQ1_9FIRM|nr:competence protein ComE [Romboutsia weinsteinii]